MKIKQISRDKIEPYIEIGMKEALLFPPNIDYYGGYIQGKLIGFVGVRWYDNKVVLNDDYILPLYRKRGYYQQLVEYRMNIIRSKGIKIVEANCTEFSLNTHLRLGAKAVHKFKNGLTKIRYENI